MRPTATGTSSGATPIFGRWRGVNAASWPYAITSMNDASVKSVSMRRQPEGLGIALEASVTIRTMAGGRLPSGTLTFLFTDIEGSTKLGVGRGTGRYHEVLEVHTRPLRAAFSDGGIEVRIDGDSLVVVFASAADA